MKPPAEKKSIFPSIMPIVLFDSLLYVAGYYQILS